MRGVFMAFGAVILSRGAGRPACFVRSIRCSPTSADGPGARQRSARACAAQPGVTSSDVRLRSARRAHRTHATRRVGDAPEGATAMRRARDPQSCIEPACRWRCTGQRSAPAVMSKRPRCESHLTSVGASSNCPSIGRSGRGRSTDPAARRPRPRARVARARPSSARPKRSCACCRPARAPRTSPRQRPRRRRPARRSRPCAPSSAASRSPALRGAAPVQRRLAQAARRCGDQKRRGAGAPPRSRVRAGEESDRTTSRGRARKSRPLGTRRCRAGAGGHAEET